MKLLSKNEAQAKVKREKESVLNDIARLREFGVKQKQLVQSIVGGSDKERIKEIADFEKFCNEILQKKSKLLEELATIEDQIEIKKDVYYSLVEKQDELDERLYQLEEREKKLDLREDFIKLIEKKQNELSR